jgi:hypothetical protein
MKEKNFIAACNLLSQPDRRSGIVSLKYCELSLVTSNPSNKMLRNSLYELRKAVSVSLLYQMVTVGMEIIYRVSKKTPWKFNRLSWIINLAKQFNFYIGQKSC